MKRYSILIAIVFILPQLVMAQNFADAFRLSYNQIQGTARSSGMGNAFGALGGDFTSLSINPAGSAVYRSGEFVITPGYYINKSEMTIKGNTFSDNRQKFMLNNVGAIGSFTTRQSESGIISVNYGVGYNRLANFNNNAFANVDGSGVSWLDDITNYANMESLSQGYLGQSIGSIEYRDWPAKLAWENYLIDPAQDNQGNDIDGQYQSILLEGETVDQRKTFAQDGRIDEYVFNVSMNFNHNFYLGATLGFHDLRYSSNSVYEEFFENGGDMTFWDDYYLNGTGFNFKIGAIYKPVQTVRLGLAFHSPTFYEIDEESTLEMQSSEQQGAVDAGTNYYNYEFNTPLKVVASGAIVFAKRGLLSADVEYMDYGTQRFRRGGNGSDNFNDLNSVMSDVFGSAINLRLGAEFKLSNEFAIRGGYEMYGNPFDGTLDAQSTLSDNVSVLSAGFGYSVNAFSLNVAYTNSVVNIFDGSVQPNYNPIDRKNTNQNILLTLGFRF